MGDKRMIIARWRGFEIDSSEGYFLYRKEPEHAEEGWSVMLKLLRSPLILDRIAFSLGPRPDQEKGLRKRLKTLLAEARLEKALPDEDYLPLDYKAPVSTFIEIVETMRDSLNLVRLNIGFKPFSDLPPEEFQKLMTWFLRPGNADEDARTARKRWNALAKVSGKDIGLIGFTDNRHAKAVSLAFEANFQLDLGKPFRYEVTTSVVDPGLIEYLFLTLTTGFDFEYVPD